MSPMMIDYFGQNFFGGFWKTQKALFPVGSSEADYTLGLSNTYRRDSQYSTDLVDTLYDIYQSTYMAKNSAPDDVEKAIAYKESNNMTTFYSRYNKLEGSDDSTTRQIVLDMIHDFNAATHGIRFAYQSGFLFITLPSGRRLAPNTTSPYPHLLITVLFRIFALQVSQLPVLSCALVR